VNDAAISSSVYPYCRAVLASAALITGPERSIFVVAAVIRRVSAHLTVTGR
jgi:uncharacterized protein (DUF1778 family)